MEKGLPHTVFDTRVFTSAQLDVMFSGAALRTCRIFSVASFGSNLRSYQMKLLFVALRPCLLPATWQT